MSLYLPKNYRNLLGSTEQTEKAIKSVKDMFQDNLSAQLALLRVTAPMTVMSGTGINDDLNGVERPVRFPVRSLDERPAEVVHSLAKWKRLKLAELRITPGRGIYTDMNALRPDEDLDNLHSIYVDQWDWEKVITRNDRTRTFLEETVHAVYKALKVTEDYMAYEYDYIGRVLPNDITFLTSQELEDMYPDLTPKEREYKAAKLHGAIFIEQIGDKLRSGERHDGRAPDYDDWSLNGDIIVYYPVLDIALELSSMGIRVDERSLAAQLKKSGCEDRAGLPFQKALLEGRLPLTIGGGIGQSRICMFFLRKAHIGEVQSSVWPDGIRATAEEHHIHLL